MKKKTILPVLFFALGSVHCGSSALDACADGKWNGQETDLDCGGPTCGPCGFHKACLADSDCGSNACDLIKVCIDPLTVSDVSPAGGPVAGGTTVTLTGTGFVPEDIVTVAGVRATNVQALSSTQLTFTTAANSSRGLGDIVVQGPTTNQATLPKAFLHFATPAFSTPVTQNIYPSIITVGKFNADPYPDVVFAAPFTNLTLLFGNGTGNFPTADSYSLGTPNMFAVGDFNADQKLDLVTSNGPFNNVLIGNGSGNFSQRIPFNGNVCASGMVTGDFNADQKLDLACAASAISILLGDGAGGLATPSAVDAGFLPAGLAVGDFNSDQKLDLYVSGGTSASVLLLGNGMGGFSAPIALKTGVLGPYVGDFNGDQKPDIIGVTTSGITLFVGNGMGDFAAPRLLTPSGPGLFAAADINGDQTLDIVFDDNTTRKAVLGDGRGGFSAPIPLAVGSFGDTRRFALADFNGDGKPDIVTASGQLSVYLNVTP